MASLIPARRRANEPIRHIIFDELHANNINQLKEFTNGKKEWRQDVHKGKEEKKSQKVAFLLISHDFHLHHHSILYMLYNI